MGRNPYGKQPYCVSQQANEPASQPTRQSAARLKMAAASQPAIYRQQASQPAICPARQAGSPSLLSQAAADRPLPPVRTAALQTDWL